MNAAATQTARQELVANAADRVLLGYYHLTAAGVKRALNEMTQPGYAPAHLVAVADDAEENGTWGRLVADTLRAAKRLGA